VEDVTFMYGPNLRVHLIDTPGFDDSSRSDVQVLQDIAHWLSYSFKNGIRLSGIIFIHRISDQRVQGSARRNLLMFKKLCGEKAYQSVVLATSMWSKVTPQEGADRERQLVENKDWWGHMYEKGSRVFRFADTAESALSIVHYILSLHQKVTLDIQDEIVNQGHDIEETAAAHELNADIIRERKKHMAELKSMHESMEEAIAQHDEELQAAFREEMETLQKKLQEGEAEQRKLQQTLKEVDKRKEEEFNKFKEQMRLQQEQERKRYEQDRNSMQQNFKKQEEQLKKKQREDMERMELSHQETKRRQEEYRREAEERRQEQARRMEQIEENHRREVAEWQETMARRKNSEIF
jgi:hypothetical protein